MALVSTNVTVLATAGGTKIAEGRGSGDTVVPVYNPAAPVWVGSTGVTTSNGILLGTGVVKDFTLHDGDILYAIANTATTTVAVLRSTP